MANQMNAQATNLRAVKTPAGVGKPFAPCKLDRLRELRATIDALRTGESQDPLLAWIVQRESALPENLPS